MSRQQYDVRCTYSVLTTGYGIPCPWGIDLEECKIRTVYSRSLNQIHNHTLNLIKAILEVKVDYSAAEISSLRTAECFLGARLQLKIDKRLKRLTHEVPIVRLFLVWWRLHDPATSTKSKCIRNWPFQCFWQLVWAPSGGQNNTNLFPNTFQFSLFWTISKNWQQIIKQKN